MKNKKRSKHKVLFLFADNTVTFFIMWYLGFYYED